MNHHRIISRKERERKGFYPTPKIWVEKSQEYFKGRKNGRLNTKSTDVKFNEWDKALWEAMQKLAGEIRPGVFEYGFLLK
jgi:hypothetical protein